MQHWLSRWTGMELIFSIDIKAPTPGRRQSLLVDFPPGAGGCDWPKQECDIPSGIPLLIGSFDFWLRVSKGCRAGRTFQHCRDKEAL